MWLSLLGTSALARVWSVPAEGTFTAVVGLAGAGDTIQLAPGTYTDAPLQFLVPLLIQGDPAGNTLIEVPSRGSGPSMQILADLTLEDITFDGLGVTQIFQMPGVNALALHRVTLRGGTDPLAYGGALSVGAFATLEATDTLFGVNSAIEGAAIDLGYSSSLLCTRCTFDNNVLTGGTGDGGAVWSFGTVTLVDSDFTYNTSPYWHGGALSVNGAAFIVGGSFVGNGAMYDGGAIIVREGSSLDIASYNGQPTRFSANSAGNGGAIGCDGGCNLSIEGAAFSGNGATLDGGHISVNRSITFSMEDTTLELGVAYGNGGAIAVDTGPLTLLRTNLCTNGAKMTGGALWSLGTIDLDNVALLANSAGMTGGGVAATGGTVSFTTALGNSAIDGAAFAGLGGPGLSLDETVLVDHTSSTAVGDVGPVTVVSGATWNNVVDYAPYAVTVTSSAALSRFPFQPLELALCATPLPEWQGELVDETTAPPYTVSDLDGTIADQGATGGPQADPSLWEDLDSDGFVSMWDCNDLDAGIFPPDCGLPLHTADTGTPDTGSETPETGTPDTATPETGTAETGTATPGTDDTTPTPTGDTASAEEPDPLPEDPARLGRGSEALLHRIVGCGCQQTRVPETGLWTLSALALALRARRERKRDS